MTSLNLGSLADTQPSRAPLSIYTTPVYAPGTAVASWLEIGVIGASGHNPAADHVVANYAYMGSNTGLAQPQCAGLWWDNPVLHSRTGYDMPLCGYELDLQNESGPSSIIPHANVGGTSKTGYSAIIGSGWHDMTAGFVTTVNYPPSTGGINGSLWKFGYWAAGVRGTAYHCDFSTNQNGAVHPDICFGNNTNAGSLIKSTGKHNDYVLYVKSEPRHGLEFMGAGQDYRMRVWAIEPTIDFCEKNAPVDHRITRFHVYNGGWDLSAVNDDYTQGRMMAGFSRTGGAAFGSIAIPECGVRIAEGRPADLVRTLYVVDGDLFWGGQRVKLE